MPKTRPGQDRLEFLIISMIELKSNITRVEDQHPGLGNDLSALCDLVIHHLEQSEDNLHSQQGAAGETPEPADNEFTPELTVQVKGESDAGTPPSHPPPVWHASDNARRERANRVTSIFDRAGDHLVNGLDKMGDGIIFVFEKLISVGSRVKRDTPEETTPT